MVDILVGGRSEVELLCGDTIVTGAAESQGPFKVKQLAHEVEVGRDVGLLHFDNVIGIVHGQVELLHKVSHCHRDGAADARQAMHQDTTVFASGFICEHKKERQGFTRLKSSLCCKCSALSLNQEGIVKQNKTIVRGSSAPKAAENV